LLPPLMFEVELPVPMSHSPLTHALPVRVTEPLGVPFVPTFPMHAEAEHFDVE
jgi:hypothetical protein